MKSIISIVFLLIMVVGCNQIKEEKSTETTNENKKGEVALEVDKVESKGNASKNDNVELLNWQQAKVTYLNFEGGFYGLITHNGDKYLPMNLDKAFKQDGAIVNIKGKVENIMTTQQWGKPFKISDIQLVKAGRVKVPAKDK